MSCEYRVGDKSFKNKAKLNEFLNPFANLEEVQQTFNTEEGFIAEFKVYVNNLKGEDITLDGFKTHISNMLNPTNIVIPIGLDKSEINNWIKQQDKFKVINLSNNTGFDDIATTLVGNVILNNVDNPADLIKGLPNSMIPKVTYKYFKSNPDILYQKIKDLILYDPTIQSTSKIDLEKAYDLVLDNLESLKSLNINEYKEIEDKVQYSNLHNVGMFSDPNINAALEKSALATIPSMIIARINSGTQDEVFDTMDGKMYTSLKSNILDDLDNEVKKHTNTISDLKLIGDPNRDDEIVWIEGIINNLNLVSDAIEEQDSIIWSKILNEVNSLNYNVDDNSIELEDMVGEINLMKEDNARFKINPVKTIGEEVVRDIVSQVKNPDSLLGLPVYFDRHDITHLTIALQSTTNEAQLLKNMKTLSTLYPEFVVFYHQLLVDEKYRFRWLSHFKKANAEKTYLASKKGHNGRALTIKLENNDGLPHFKKGVIMNASFVKEKLLDKKALLKRIEVAEQKAFNKVFSNAVDAQNHFVQTLMGIDNLDKLGGILTELFKSVGLDFTYDFTQSYITNELKMIIGSKTGENRLRAIRINLDKLSNIYYQVKHFSQSTETSINFTSQLSNYLKHPMQFTKGSKIMFRSIAGNMEYSINENDFISNFYNRLDAYLLGDEQTFEDELLKLYNIQDKHGNRLLEKLPIFQLGQGIVDNGVVNRAELANWMFQRAAGANEETSRGNGKEYKSLNQKDWDIVQLAYFLQSDINTKTINLNKKYYMQPSVIPADRSHTALHAMKIYDFNLAEISNLEFLVSRDLRGDGDLKPDGLFNSMVFRSIVDLFDIDVNLMVSEYVRLFGSEVSEPTNNVSNSITTIEEQHFAQGDNGKIFVDKSGLKGNAFKLRTFYIEKDGKKMYLSDFILAKHGTMFDGVIMENGSFNIGELYNRKLYTTFIRLKNEFVKQVILDEIKKINDIYDNDEYFEIFRKELSVKVIADKAATKEELTRAKYKDRLVAYTISNMINLYQQQWIFTGHISQYSSGTSYNKRMQALLSSGRGHAFRDRSDSFRSLTIHDKIEIGSLHDEIIDGIIGNIKKSFPDLQNKGVNFIKVQNYILGDRSGLNKKDIPKTKDMNNLELKLVDVIKNTFSIVSTDGVSIIRDTELKERLIRNGQYAKFESSLDKLLDLEGVEIPTQGFNPLKEFYRNLSIDDNGLTPRSKQVKNSTFIIFDKIVKGTILEDISKFMEINNIQQLNFKSSVKEGNKGSINLLDNLEEYTSRVLTDEEALLIDDDLYANLIVQQELPESPNEHKNKLGVQISKIILSNINPTNIYNVPGFGKILGSDISESLLSIFSKNIEDSATKLLIELGMKTIYDKPNIEKFVSIIKDELSRRGSHNVMYSAIEVQYMKDIITLKNPISLNTSEYKFKQLILSLFTNRITSQKINGDHLIQVSESIIRKSKVSLESDDLKFDGMLDRKLQVTKEANGSYVMEVYIRKPKNVKDLPELQRIGADKFVLYRIPTEDKRSMAIGKIVGFLPDTYKGSIVLPADIVSQTGSDFDIDTLYLIQYGLYRKDKTLYKHGLSHDETDYYRYINSFLPSTLRVVESGKDDLGSLSQNSISYINKLLTRDSISIGELYKRYKLETKGLNMDIVSSNKDIKDLFADLSELSNDEWGKYNYGGVILREFKELKQTYKEYGKIGVTSNLDKYIAYRDLFFKHLTYEQEVVKRRNESLNEKGTPINPAAKFYSDELIENLTAIVGTYDKILLTYIEKNKIYDVVQESNGTFLEDKDMIVEALAKRYGLPSRSEYIKMPDLNRKTTSQRDNDILSHMIGILSNFDQVLEMNNPATFEAISEAKNLLYSLSIGINERAKLSDDDRIVSPFTLSDNRLLRRRNMEGKMLKANSVARDGVLNINQQIKAFIPIRDNLGEKVYLTGAKGLPSYIKTYSIEGLEAKYNITVTDEDKARGYTYLYYNKFGRDDKGGFTNKDGFNITAYSSQTTANILDNAKNPVPEGFDSFGFEIIKTMIEMGYDYDFVTLFINQESIKAIGDKASTQKDSIFFDNFGDHVEEIKNKYYYQLYKMLSTGEQKLLKKYVDNKYINNKNKTLSIPTGQNQQLAISLLTGSRMPVSIFSTLDFANFILNANKIKKIVEIGANDELIKQHIADQLAVIEFYKRANAATKAITTILVGYRMDKLGAGPSPVKTQNFERKALESIANYFDIDLKDSTKDKDSEIPSVIIEDKNGYHIPVLLAMYPSLVEVDNTNLDTNSLTIAEHIKYILDGRRVDEGGIITELDRALDYDSEYILGLKSVYPHFEAYYKYANKFSMRYLNGIFETESEYIRAIKRELNPDNNEEIDRVINSTIKTFGLYNTSLMNKYKPLKGNIPNAEAFKLLSKEGLTVTEKDYKFYIGEELVDIDFENPTDAQLNQFESFNLVTKVTLLKNSFYYRNKFKNLNAFDILKALEFKNDPKSVYKNSYVRIISNVDEVDADLAEESLVHLWIGNDIERLVFKELLAYTILVEGFSFSSKNISRFINPNILSNPISKTRLENMSKNYFDGLGLADEYLNYVNNIRNTEELKVTILSAIREYSNIVPQVYPNNKNIKSVGDFYIVKGENIKKVNKKLEYKKVVKILTKQDTSLMLNEFKSNGMASYITEHYKNWADPTIDNVVVTSQDSFLRENDITNLDLTHRDSVGDRENLFATIKVNKITNLGTSDIRRLIITLHPDFVLNPKDSDISALTKEEKKEYFIDMSQEEREAFQRYVLDTFKERSISATRSIIQKAAGIAFTGPVSTISDWLSAPILNNVNLINFKTVATSNRIEFKEDQTVPYYVFKYTYGENSQNFTPKANKRKAKDLYVLIELSKVLKGEAGMFSVLPENNPLTTHKGQTYLSNYQVKIQEFIDNASYYIEELSIIDQKEEQDRANAKAEADDNMQFSVLTSKLHNSNKVNFMHSSKIDLKTYITRSRNYISQVVYRNDGMRKYEGVREELGNEDLDVKELDSSVAQRILAHLVAVQDSDLEYINFIVNQVSKVKMPHLEELIIKLANGEDIADIVTQKGQEIASNLYQSQLAFSFIEAPLSLDYISGISLKDITNTSIKKMKEKAPSIVEAKIAHQKLVSKFIELYLTRLSSSPEILYGYKTIMDPVDDEIILQHMLGSAAYSHSEIMGLAFKELAIVEDIGKNKHKKDMQRLDKLIKDYNGTTNLSNDDWESFFENINGETSEWFLSRGSKQLLDAEFNRRLDEQILSHPTMSKSKLKNKVRNSMVIDGYLEVREADWRADVAAKEKEYGTANYPKEIGDTLLRKWMMANSIFENYTAYPGVKYYAPNSKNPNLVSKNKKGQSIDDFIDIEGNHVNELGAIFKFYTELSKELASLPGTQNDVANGRIPYIANPDSFSYTEAIRNGEFKNLIKQTAKNVGYYSTSEKKVYENMDGSESRRLEFNHISKMIDYSMPYDTVKKPKEKEDDYKARIVANMIEFLTGLEKEYNSPREFKFKHMTFENAIAIANIFSMGKTINITKPKDGTDDELIKANIKTAKAINKFYEGKFEASDVKLFNYFNMKIRDRNNKITKELQSKDYKAMMTIFSITSRLYQAKKQQEDNMLLYSSYINSEDYKVRKTTYSGKHKYKLGTLNTEREKTKRGKTDPSAIPITIDGETRLGKHFKEAVKMLLYDEFDKDQGMVTKVTRVIMNYTSAKGMWLNITGAFDNISYGTMQMAMEIAGGEFTNPQDKSFAKILADIQSTYYGGLTSYMMDTGEYATTLQSGLIKRFDIVALQDEKAMSMDYQMKKQSISPLYQFKNLYLFYHAGEHMMQNQMLFAMMKAHRVINGKIMSFNDFMGDARLEVLNELGLANDLNKSIDRALAKDRGFTEISRVVSHFILGLNKEQATKVTDAIKKYKEDKIAEFITKPTLYEAFELKEGRAEIAQEKGFHINQQELEDFTRRVKLVNQRVHGIYNKFDSGIIQRTAQGKLIVHFRRWLVPAINKRIGSKPGKAFWNESLSSKDKGTYIAFGQYLYDLHRFYKNAGLIWSTLDEQDKASILMVAAELTEILGIALTYGAALAMDLDDEDDDNLAIAITLNRVGRLYDELTQFTPLGVLDTAKDLKSNPFASERTLISLGKFVSHIMEGLYSGDWEYEGGQYNGENKLTVDFLRNTPVITQLDKFTSNRFAGINSFQYSKSVMSSLNDEDEDNE